MQILVHLFYTLSIFLIIATILPLVRRDHWTFRAFEFPRIQKLVITLITLALGLFAWQWETWYIITYGLDIFILIHLSYLIFPFTVLGPKTLANADNNSECIHLFIANVYQYNQQCSRLVKLLQKENPDLVLLVETNKHWQEQIKPATNDYPYKIEIPLDNTYGMLFYSRFPIKDESVRYLVNENYPSIKARIETNNGYFQFNGVHPPPPSPTERAYSTPRDTELMRLAEELQKEPDKPTIVAGDLNDVAWSFTTYEFLRRSGLKDPRKGRGIFPSFHASNILMRWPLDHIFCSTHFNIKKLRLLSPIGSDHFPVSVMLELADPSRQR